MKLKRIFSVISHLFIKIFSKLDWLLISFSALCVGFGLVFIYSATRSMSDRYITVQLVAIAIGYVAMLVMANIDYEFWMKIWPVVFIVCIVCEVFTMVFASSRNGNSAWINLGVVSIQLSEFIKIGFILSLTSHIALIKEKLHQLRHVILLFLHLLFFTGLIIIEGDLGQSLVFLFVGIVILFAAGVKKRYMAGAFLLAVAMSPLLWRFLSLYQQKRIIVGFDPFIDPQDSGYQAIQSLTAIGSGQLYGKGFLEGVRAQGSMLPEKHTDFIFAVAGEEFGFIGAMLIVFLLLILLLKILYTSMTVKNSQSGSLICVGVFAMICFQSIENIGMCMGTLPVVGITLPFFSYGGSSVLSALMSLGLVLSVSKHKKVKPLTFYDG